MYVYHQHPMLRTLNCFVQFLHSLNYIPETVISDNGSCFISEQFRQFLNFNGIKQITSALHHPSTNGLAKRAQIIKRDLKRQQMNQLNLHLQKFCLLIKIPYIVLQVVH